MKQYILTLLLGLFYLYVGAQEIFKFDFSKDPIDEFMVWDVDKNIPILAMEKIGFKVGSPWVKIRENNQSPNWFYGSTSSYKPAGQANDWLVTKGLFIQSEGCVLEWKSQAYDPKKRDGLKIFISTTGQSIENFSNIPDWEIEEESAGTSENRDVIEGEGEWTQHSLSLDKYAGQTIYIAFVNQSYDKSIIFIDDIWVGKHQNYTFSDDSEKYVVSEEGEIKGTLIISKDILVDSYTVHCSYNGKEYSKEYTGLNLKQGDTHSFVLDEKVPLELNQPVEYKLWIMHNAENSLYVTGSITRISHFPKRTVVIEEGTGTWCKFCVMGMWAMEHLYKLSKDAGDFIGIAVHNGDQMTNHAYDSALGFKSFPMGAVNRKFSSSPLSESYENPWGKDSFVFYYLKEREEKIFLDMNVEGSYDSDSTRINAKATVTSVLSMNNTDYRIAFVLLENGVTGYSQFNAFAGSPYPMGGFEKLTNPCYPVFNDVARGIWPKFTGAENSVPASLNPGESIEYSYEIDIPKAVDDIKKLRLVALLINAYTQEIVNGAVCLMTDISDIRTSSITHNRTVPDKIVTEVKNEGISIFVDSDDEVNAELFDVTGKKINEMNAKGRTSFTLSANGYRGITLLFIRNGHNIYTKKVIL